MANISENLFQAIDILTAKRLEGLKYDKTLLCEIIDNTKAERGEYRVTDGSSTFTAYSDITTYKNGVSVYVTIPEGDYSQRKIISGRYVEDGGEYYTYIAPFESYLDITNNFIETNIGQKSLLANGARNEINVFEWHRTNTNTIPKQYSRMGLKADFRTWLNKLQPVTGSYGLRIDIVSREVQNVISDNLSHKTYSYYLDSSDFYGDIYNFETFYQQELVFDISMITEIQDLKISFYQSSNFYDITKNKIPTTDGGELLDDNIFIKDIYLSFGFDAAQFIEDEVFLYTLDGETYDVSGANVKGKDGKTYNKNIKNLKARWVHFISKGQALMIDETKDFNTDEATLHWYKYKQQDGVYDKLAGDLWEEITKALNKFELQITPDITQQHEYYKLIVEYPNSTWIEENAALKIADLGSASQYGICDENGNWTTKGSLHSDRAILMNEIKAIEKKIGTIDEEIGDRVVLERKKQQLSSIETSLDSFKNSVVQIWSDYNAMRKLYYSDVLTLTNETLVPSSPNLELVDGLNIIVDEGGLKGNYTIYGITNEVMKSTDAMKSRVLEAVYKSIITKDVNLNKASSICWKIPSHATMIAEPVLGQDYVTKKYVDNLPEEEKKKYTEFDYIATTMKVDNKTITLVDDKTEELIPYNGFYWLIRKGTEIYHDDNQNGEAPTSQQISTKQTFKIKKYYQQSAKNNTVYCDVIKNGFTYSAQADLTFGLHGTNGTDNTLLLQMRKYKVEDGKVVPLDLVSTVHPGAQNVMIEARLFDYNNEELQIKDVTWSMYSKGDVSSLYIDTTEKVPMSYTRTQKVSSFDKFGELVETEQDITIHCIPIIVKNLTGNDITPFMHNIVQADVFYGECIVGQTATGGIDFERVDANGNASLNAVKSKTRRVSLTAYMPIPFASNTKLIWAEIPTQVVYDASGAKPSYYKDPIKICDSSGNYVKITSCRIIHGDEEKNNAYYPTVKTTQYGEFTIKPLNMFLHNLSKQISLECTVAGVGTWVQPILMIQNRWPSAVLNEWDGSLTIDEKNGTILSTMVGAGKKEGDNTFTGVLMGDVATGADINTAQTGVFGYHHGVQSFGLKDDGTAFFGKPGKGQIIFDGNSGVIQSMSYDVSGGTGMKIDLDDGVIDMRGSITNTTTNDNTTKRVYTSSGSRILLDVAGSASKPYFLIQAASGDYQNSGGDSAELMYVGLSKYFLKTVNFTTRTNEETGYKGQGMKIDLAKGSIEGYDFSLRGYAAADAGRYAGSYFSLNSNGSPFFRIHFKDSETDRDLHLVNITRSDFKLQSQNWSASAKTGLQFDLTDGKLTGYDFVLESKGSDNKSRVRLSNTNAYFYINNSAGKRLINISDEGYYLQSSDYADGAGMQINLDSGKITAYNFKLYAKSSEDSGGYIHISSTDSYPLNINGYFKVDWAGNVSISGNLKVTGTTDIGGDTTISSDALITGDLTVYGSISSGDSGYYNFFQNGATIGGWQITTTAIKNISGTIELNSSSGYIQAKSGSNYCKMDTDGSFFANYGEIGGWKIDTSRIYKNNTTYLKSDGSMNLGGQFQVDSSGNVTMDGTMKFTEDKGKIQFGDKASLSWSGSKLSVGLSATFYAGQVDCAGLGITIAPFSSTTAGISFSSSDLSFTATIKDFYNMKTLTNWFIDAGANNSAIVTKIVNAANVASKFDSGESTTIVVDIPLETGGGKYTLTFSDGLLTGCVKG